MSGKDQHNQAPCKSIEWSDVSSALPARRGIRSMDSLGASLLAAVARWPVACLVRGHLSATPAPLGGRRCPRCLIPAEEYQAPSAQDRRLSAMAVISASVRRDREDDWQIEHSRDSALLHRIVEGRDRDDHAAHRALWRIA